MSIFIYLKRLPAFDRYVGGGEAPRTTPACLSRSNNSNLYILEKKKMEKIIDKNSIKHIFLYKYIDIYNIDL